jgi:hypothetical protein
MPVIRKPILSTQRKRSMLLHCLLTFPTDIAWKRALNDNDATSESVHEMIRSPISFKLRAEILDDADQLLSHLCDRLSSYRIKSTRDCRGNVSLQGVELVLTVSLNLNQLRKIIRTIDNSQVMLETLNYESKYSGYRRYTDAYETGENVMEQITN